MGAGHIQNLRDSHISALTLEGRDRYWSTGRQIDGSRYNRTLHYGYNTTWPRNITGEVHYGNKVWELGTYLI